MRKLIWTFAGLSLSAVLVLGTRVPVTAEAPSFPEAAPAAPVGQPQRTAAPALGPFEIKAKDGNFFICAATYSGEHAPYLADQVVRQLRAKNINSFVCTFADLERLKQQQEYHEWMKKNPTAAYRPRFTRIQQQVAVLIGGFKTMEDASKSLPTVRQLPPPKVTFPSGEEAADRVIIYADGPRPPEKSPRRGFVQDLTPSRFENQAASSVPSEEEETHGVKGSFVNPFVTCFVVPNPAKKEKRPEDRENYVDPAWKKMNANEPYSLLRCKKNYTLVVKIYRGSTWHQSSTNPKKDDGFLSKMNNTNQLDAREASARQAHALAEFLRESSKGKFEAYVLHTRYYSIVTVGGFAAQGDREMLEMRDQLAKVQLKIIKGGVNLGTPSIDPNDNPLALLPDPMPMRVPKL